MIETKREVFGYVAEYENKYFGVIKENYLPKKCGFVDLNNAFILCEKNLKTPIDFLNEIYVDNILDIKRDKSYEEMINKCTLKKIKITTTQKTEIIND